MSIWSSAYVLVLGGLVLVWAGISAYVLITRALYDFRGLTFQGARRVVRPLLDNTHDEDGRTRILRRLPRRTLVGLASDASAPAGLAAEAAAIVLERRWERLLRRAGSHRNEAEKWRRIALLRVFSLAGWSVSTPLLRDALASGDDDVAGAAVTLLGARSDDLATALLAEALVANRVSRSRIATRLEGRDGLELHLLPLIDHPDAEVRYWVATLLRPSPELPHVELALASLGGDPSPNVRVAVAKSLTAAGGTLALSMALDFITDPVWYVRAQAARALGRVGTVDLGEQLLELLGDEQWWVRAAAKESLVALGEGVVPTVASVLDEDDRFARNGAAEVLFELGAVADWASRAAGRHPEYDAERLLEKTLVAGGHEVQRAAARQATGQARQAIERIIAELPQALPA